MPCTCFRWNVSGKMIEACCRPFQDYLLINHRWLITSVRHLIARSWALLYELRRHPHPLLDSNLVRDFFYLTLRLIGRLGCVVTKSWGFVHTLGLFFAFFLFYKLIFLSNSDQSLVKVRLKLLQTIILMLAVSNSEGVS